MLYNNQKVKKVKTTGKIGKTTKAKGNLPLGLANVATTSDLQIEHHRSFHLLLNRYHLFSLGPFEDTYDVFAAC